VSTGVYRSEELRNWEIKMKVVVTLFSNYSTVRRLSPSSPISFTPTVVVSFAESLFVCFEVKVLTIHWENCITSTYVKMLFRFFCLHFEQLGIFRAFFSVSTSYDSKLIASVWPSSDQQHPLKVVFLG
jgi:hypothetical protein